MRRLRHLLLMGLACWSLLAVAPAHAGGDAAQARIHFERGKTFFEVDQYKKAIEEFKAAHIQRPDPAFLYNIAECHRRAGEPRDALVFYRRFLSAAPAADKTRAIADKRIVEMQAAVDDEAKSDPGLDPGSVRDAALTAPEPAAAAPFVGQHSDVPVREARPLYKRTWFLATVGAVVVVSAVGIWALSRGRDLPDTALGNQSIF